MVRVLLVLAGQPNGQSGSNSGQKFHQGDRHLGAADFEGLTSAWLAEARRGADPRLAPRASRRKLPEMSDSASRRLGASGLTRSTLTVPKSLSASRVDVTNLLFE